MPNFNKKLLIFIANFTFLVFPCFSISCIIFLCIASNINGTHTKTDTLYSFKFCAICLKPSQNTFFAPQLKKNVKPVEPNVWWNGKNAILTSVSYIFSADVNAYMFDAIFLCDNITALAKDVVPDVNNTILIALLSISAFKYSLFPFKISCFPSNNNSFIFLNLFSSTLSMQIYSLSCVLLFFIMFKIISV